MFFLENLLTYATIILSILIVLAALVLNKLSRPFKFEIDPKLYKWSNNDAQRFDDNMPPTYPNSWLPILDSNELLKNQIKPIFAIGKDLVVYRGSSGKCYAFDAYCPHLGANLGVGGTIIGESVECPFHGWVFDNNGKCTHTPGSENPVNANLNKYIIQEVNGFICIWYHNLGQEPNWFPVSPDGINMDEMVYRGKGINVLYCHLQEISEHSGDLEHFEFLHRAPVFMGDLISKPPLFDKITKLINYQFKLDKNVWKADTGTSKHCAYMDLETQINIFGFKIPLIRMMGHFMGMALSNLKFEINLFGKRVFYISQGAILEQNMKFRLCSKVYSQGGLINSWLAKFATRGICDMIGRDTIVFANKKYLSHPILAKNEKLISDFRKWSKQFY